MNTIPNAESAPYHPAYKPNYISADSSGILQYQLERKGGDILLLHDEWPLKAAYDARSMTGYHCILIFTLVSIPFLFYVGDHNTESTIQSPPSAHVGMDFLSRRGHSNLTNTFTRMPKNMLEANGNDVNNGGYHESIDLSMAENWLIREEVLAICKPAIERYFGGHVSPCSRSFLTQNAADA